MLTSKKYRIAFSFLLTINVLGLLFLYLKKDNLIPMYRKLTRVYISFKQRKVYNKDSIKFNQEFKSNNEDIITPVFQSGKSTSDLDQYKTIELRCGYSQKKHGYLK